MAGAVFVGTLELQYDLASAAMRRARIKADGAGYYHCSRIIAFNDLLRTRVWSFQHICSSQNILKTNYRC